MGVMTGLATAAKWPAVASLLLTAVTVESGVSATFGDLNVRLTTDATGCSSSIDDEKAVLTVHRAAAADVRIEITKTAVRVDGTAVANLTETTKDVRIRHFGGVLMLFLDGELVETDP